MSDSYSAWCDEIDKKIISDKKKYSDEVRNSQKYKERFKKCSDSLKTSNLHCLMCCGTCGNKVVDNYKSTIGCKTLGIDNISTLWCCEHWNPQSVKSSHVIFCDGRIMTKTDKDYVELLEGRFDTEDTDYPCKDCKNRVVNEQITYDKFGRQIFGCLLDCSMKNYSDFKNGKICKKHEAGDSNVYWP